MTKRERKRILKAIRLFASDELLTDGSIYHDAMVILYELAGREPPKWERIPPTTIRELCQTGTGD